jgi:hypothetical protein
LPGILGTSDTADQFLGLTTEHTAADHFDPARMIIYYVQNSYSKLISQGITRNRKLIILSIKDSHLR